MRSEPIVTRLGLLFLLTLAVGCGGPARTELSGDGPGTSSTQDAGDDASSSTPAMDSGPVEQFATVDAAAGMGFACKPGTYAGTFETQITSDAGGLFAFFSLNFKGTLSITIVGEMTQTTGEVPQTTYSIAPGAEVNGTDQSFGGTYQADLTGQLDCATKTFTGTMNGVYLLFGSDAGTIPLQGALTGTYDDADAAAPRLSGTMTLTSTNVPGLGAAGPWTASLQ
jgi:hypothetical protein